VVLLYGEAYWFLGDFINSRRPEIPALLGNRGRETKAEARAYMRNFDMGFTRSPPHAQRFFHPPLATVSKPSTPRGTHCLLE